MDRKRVAVLISGRGSNMAALIEAAKDKNYPADIALVLSNRPDAGGLLVARGQQSQPRSWTTLPSGMIAMPSKGRCKPSLKNIHRYRLSRRLHAASHR